MTMTATDLWSEVYDERRALLETLTPADWDAPGLCAGWRVRDVVGHMVSGKGCRAGRCHHGSPSGRRSKTS